MARIGSFLYNAVAKRTSTFLVVAVGSAFFMERGIDIITDTIFDNKNKGKQWKDFKHQFEKEGQ